MKTVQNSQNPQEPDRTDRDATGRFKPGNPGGPGRPRAGSKGISETELRRLAKPIEPADVFRRLRKFDELADTLDVAMKGETYSDAAKQTLRLEIENQRMATILVNQRLRQELKQTVGV